MRWSIAPVKPPERGDRREIRRFAFFPTDIGTTRIWLETYTSIEEFQLKYGFGESPELVWVEVERELLDYYY